MINIDDNEEIKNNNQIFFYNLLNREKSMLNDEKVFILFGFFNRK